MKNPSKCIAALFLMSSLTSCYNSHNANDILGKWKGVYTENCSTSQRVSAVEIQFNNDKTFVAVITPPDGKPEMTAGTYVVERYQLIFITNKKERDVQKIEHISDGEYEATFQNERCSGSTKLRKVKDEPSK